MTLIEIYAIIMAVPVYSNFLTLKKAAFRNRYCWNFTILSSDIFQPPNMRHHEKFYGNWSNCMAETRRFFSYQNGELPRQHVC